jgi:hypothetical protein
MKKVWQTSKDKQQIPDRFVGVEAWSQDCLVGQA